MFYCSVLLSAGDTCLELVTRAFWDMFTCVADGNHVGPNRATPRMLPDEFPHSSLDGAVQLRALRYGTSVVCKVREVVQHTRVRSRAPAPVLVPTTSVAALGGGAACLRRAAPFSPSFSPAAATHILQPDRRAYQVRAQ